MEGEKVELARFLRVMKWVGRTRSATLLAELDQIVEHGADPNLQDNWGRTVLHRLSDRIAVHRRRALTMFDNLVAVGADVNIQDRLGRTPLHILMGNVGEHHAESIFPVFDKLVEHGALHNLHDSTGRTALQIGLDFLLDKVGSCRADHIIPKLDRSWNVEPN